MKAYRRNGRTASLLLHSTLDRGSGQSHAPAALTKGESPVPTEQEAG